LPLKGEALTNPHYAQKVFLESLGIKVEARQSLATMPPAHGVVFISAWHWDLIESRKQALETWVRSGGRLVVDESLIDSLGAFAEFSGITLKYPEYDEDEDEEGEQDAGEREQGSPAETIDGTLDIPAVVEESRCVMWKVTVDLHGASGSRDHYEFCPAETIGWLATTTKPIWAVSDRYGYQAVRVQVGAGSVTSINASVFENRDFNEIPRGALYVAAGQLRQSDSVWLLTETEFPSLLTLVWRHGAPVVLLFGLFVIAAIWRSAVRLGPLRAPPIAARRSLAEQIRGTGWFILRLGGSRTLLKAVARSLREEAMRRISRYARLTPAQQLDALVARTGLDRNELQQALVAVSAQPNRPQLYKAITLLETARRVLAQESSIDPQSNLPSGIQPVDTNSSGIEKAPHAN
jgi:hypothetical protein